VIFLAILVQIFTSIQTTTKACCDAHYSYKDDCVHASTNVVDKGQWYPDAYGCTSAVPPPPYIAKFFPTEDECCKDNYCRTPDVTPPSISPQTLSPTQSPTQSPTPGPMIMTPAPINIAVTETTPTVNSALSNGGSSVTNNPTPVNLVTAETPSTLIAEGATYQVSPRPMSGNNPTQTNGDLSVSQPNGDWDVMRNFYPDFGVSEGCRNDGNYPEWITKDMMKSSKLECCQSYFSSSVENCNSNHLFYPNFQVGSCVNDGKHPQWMGGAYLVETMLLCCSRFFRNSESQQRCNSLGR
jgi:hypothetical protein